MYFDSGENPNLSILVKRPLKSGKCTSMQGCFHLSFSNKFYFSHTLIHPQSHAICLPLLRFLIPSIHPTRLPDNSPFCSSTSFSSSPNSSSTLRFWFNQLNDTGMTRAWGSGKGKQRKTGWEWMARPLYVRPTSTPSVGAKQRLNFGRC